MKFSHHLPRSLMSKAHRSPFPTRSTLKELFLNLKENGMELLDLMGKNI